MMSVVISIMPDAYQHDLSLVMFGTILSPLRVTLVGSAGLTAFLAILHLSLIASLMSAGCIMLATLGSDPVDMYYHVIRLVRTTGGQVKRAVPDTGTEWGIVAIVGAFLLLGIGAIVSLKAPPVPPAPPPEEPAPMV
jgi:hypothetical protein